MEREITARAVRARDRTPSPAFVSLSPVEFPSARYGRRPAGNIGKLLYDFCDTVQEGQTTTFKAQGLCP